MVPPELCDRHSVQRGDGHRRNSQSSLITIVRLVHHRVPRRVSPWPAADLLPHELPSAGLRAPSRPRRASSAGPPDHVRQRAVEPPTQSLPGLRTRRDPHLVRPKARNASIRHRRARRASAHAVRLDGAPGGSKLSSDITRVVPHLYTGRSREAISAGRATIGGPRRIAGPARSGSSRDEPNSAPTHQVS